jgi:hypothetical protein
MLINPKQKSIEQIMQERGVGTKPSLSSWAQQLRGMAGAGTKAAISKSPEQLGELSKAAGEGREERADIKEMIQFSQTPVGKMVQQPSGMVGVAETIKKGAEEGYEYSKEATKDMDTYDKGKGLRPLIIGGNVIAGALGKPFEPLMNLFTKFDIQPDSVQDFAEIAKDYYADASPEKQEEVNAALEEAIAKAESPEQQASMAAIQGAMGYGSLIPAVQALPEGGVVAPRATPKDLAKIQENLKPKMTAAEQRLALQEGRVTKTKEGIITGKKPDVIDPKAEAIKSSEIIAERIEGAAKMDKPTLYKSVTEEIKSIAKPLEADLKKLTMEQWDKDVIAQDWAKVKAEQLKNPNVLASDMTIKRMQKVFDEQVLKRIEKAQNKAELWDVAKSYDATIPENIKNPSVTASDQVLAAHDLWLENRAILKKSINDIDFGGATASSEAFQEMHSLYEAKNAMEMNPMVDIKGTPGIIEQKIGTGPISKAGLIKTGAAIWGGKQLYDWLR